MDVVRHHTKPEDSQAVTRTLLAKEAQIANVVAVVKEDLLAVVSPLGDVVWGSGHNHASCSRQGASIADALMGLSALTVHGDVPRMLASIAQDIRGQSRLTVPYA
jgi:hypothetical protein